MRHKPLIPVRNLTDKELANIGKRRKIYAKPGGCRFHFVQRIDDGVEVLIFKSWSQKYGWSYEAFASYLAKFKVFSVAKVAP